MKPSLLVGLLMTVSLTALAQGKVNVVNDGASLVALTTDTSMVLPADRGLAGQAIGNATPLPSGVVLMGGLWAGTSSSQLFYYAPNNPAAALMNNASAGAGLVGPFQVQLNAATSSGGPSIPGIVSGTAITASTPWFQVRVWDSAYPSYAAAFGHSYTFESYLFQMNPGPSLSYTFTAPAGPNSTWVEGWITFPEPSSAALVGLGAATLLMLRRRR